MHVKVCGYRGLANMFQIGSYCWSTSAPRIKGKTGPGSPQTVKTLRYLSLQRDPSIILLIPVMSVALYRWKVVKKNHIFLMKLVLI